MKLMIILSLLLTSCAGPRILAKDCQKLEGVDLMNCELVKKL